MNTISKFLGALWTEEDGQDLVEYALLLAFIVLSAVAFLASVRGTTRGFWSTINSTLSSASTTAS